MAVALCAGESLLLHEVTIMSEYIPDKPLPDALPSSLKPAKAKTKKSSVAKRARKLPLYQHRNGQWCKRIRGKLYYFGTNKQEALRRYYEESTALHSGRGHSEGQPSRQPDTMTLRDLCNSYIHHQRTRAAAGKIRLRQSIEPEGRLKTFVQFLGPDRLVSTIKAIDLENYQAARVEAGKAPTTINNDLAPVKALFNWAVKMELIDKGPNCAAIERVPVPEVDRPIFSPDEFERLFDLANTQMKAMLLLGLNCGLGCTDCAELEWKHLDLVGGRMDYPRPKTGVDRNLKLWHRTIQALKAIPVRGDYVFYTKAGNQWGWRVSGKYDDKPLTRAFKRLMKRVGIPQKRGMGFYTLRRTAATIAAQTGDVFAVQSILGHKDLKMASRYVQRAKLTPQSDRAIEHMQTWLEQYVKDPGNSG
jgi:integrase